MREGKVGTIKYEASRADHRSRLRKKQVVLTRRNTLESIEVELPLERRKLGLAEPPVYGDN
jgi:hypothetical protein